MVRLGLVWRLACERAKFGLQSWWHSLPTAQWSILGVLASSALLALSVVVLWHTEGNPWVFCFGLMTAGQIAGAAIGIAHRQVPQAAFWGSLGGLLFFVYAAIT